MNSNFLMKKLDRMDKQKREFILFLFWMVGGNLVYAIGFNMLILPVGLYSGGFMGISQLIRLFVMEVLKLPIPASIDIVGIVYFILNVPLFLVAYKMVGRDYCTKSLVAVVVCSVSLTIVPVMEQPILHETIATCIVGGVVCGVGAGMILRSGSAGGGQDIIGVIVSIINPNASVGGISIVLNFCVYAICLFIFDIETVIYSLIFTTILAMYMDKVFVQNVNVQATIFTKVDGIDKIIMEEMTRGVTEWQGEGAYTHDVMHVLVTVISKYEMEKLKTIVTEHDPKAFVIFNEGMNIRGNFQKRLTR